MSKPKWYLNSLFYQIYPQSFQDSNDDGIGDLEGIISKLDYLQSLGIDAIWLNPIYVSPFKDAGYDISNYKDIAPRYGNLNTYDRLIKEVHKRGIKILGDLVFAATSDKHPWFRDSQKTEKNRYSKWYVWCEDPQSIKVDTGAWMINEAERHEAYYIGWLPHQPWLNYGFPGLFKENGNSYDDPDLKALRKELKDVVRFWLDRGIDGFRVDAIEALIPGEKLHENTIRFWNEIRDVLNCYGDKAYIAEGWNHPVEDILRCKFKGCFFLPQHQKLLSWRYEKDKKNFSEKRFFSPKGGDIKWFVEEYFKAYNKVIKHDRILNMVSGNHDLPRMSGVCQKDEIIKCYFAMLLTYPTAPFIYYGDEIGMRYWEKLPSKEGAGPRAGSRTPMQWNSKKNAGFSSADASKLYFPINEDYPTRNVERQETSSDSVLNTVRKLIKLRKSNPSLGAFAGIRHLHLKRGVKTYIYSRYGEGDAFVIVLNPSDIPCNLTVKLTGKEEEFRDAKYLVPELYSQETQKITVEKELSFQFPSNFFAIYRIL